MAAPPSPTPATPAQPLPLLERRLRVLANKVLEIGYGRAGANPERVLSAKTEIAAELEALADMIARCAR